MIPTPEHIGLPRKFVQWRPQQWQAIQDGVECKSRFVVQVQRPGAGKSVTYFTQGLLHKNQRKVFLTVQKGLQDQLLVDFQQIGLTDIRGKAAYKCDGLPGHNCDEGLAAKCMFKGTSLCTYNSAFQDANETQLLTTNYSCWIASNRYGKGFGKFDVMVCDEAHNIPDQVAKAMQVVLSEREILEGLDRDWPQARERGDMQAWKHWSLVSYSIANAKLQILKSGIEQERKPKQSLIKEYQHLTQLVRRLADIATCKPEKWIVDNHTYGFQFDPIDASEYTERVLFKGIPKVLLTSASIHPKTLKDCYISEDDYEFFDYPSTSITRSPIIYIPTTKVNRYSQPWELRKLVDRVDEIIESRGNRKGIVHTANFKIRDLIMSQSKFKGKPWMISNYSSNGDITSQVVERFKAVKGRAVLVSPSIKEGYDLPYDACRYQIVAKLDFPYAGTKVEKAREALDPERSAFRVFQSLKQAIGRADRADDDWQEVFIIDGAMPTMIWKYGHLAAPEIIACYRVCQEVPPMEDSL